MSMETHVFFRGKPPSKAAPARAMKELGPPFSITPATGAIQRVTSACLRPSHMAACQRPDNQISSFPKRRILPRM